jgi:hypothetical protein
MFNTTSFYTLFESFETQWSAALTKIATAAVLHLLHAIWLARNGIWFNNANITVHVAKMKVLSSIKLSAALLPELPYIADHELLHNLSVTAIPVAATVTQLWKTPIIGWMKANTDGSVTVTSAACGRLFRDYMANFRGGFAQKINGLSVIHAELMDLILAMELAHSKHWHFLWLV